MIEITIKARYTPDLKHYPGIDNELDAAKSDVAQVDSGETGLDDLLDGMDIEVFDIQVVEK